MSIFSIYFFSFLTVFELFICWMRGCILHMCVHVCPSSSFFKSVVVVGLWNICFPVCTLRTSSLGRRAMECWSGERYKIIFFFCYLSHNCRQGERNDLSYVYPAPLCSVRSGWVVSSSFCFLVFWRHQLELYFYLISFAYLSSK